jgi:alpha-aminoadipate carrier protein LysW
MTHFESECPVCGVTLSLAQDTVQSELKDCTDCGTELEVTGLEPFTLSEAPQEEEDWGQ